MAIVNNQAMGGLDHPLRLRDVDPYGLFPEDGDEQASDDTEPYDPRVLQAMQ